MENERKKRKGHELKGNLRSKFKKVLKSDKGLKTKMSVLAEEEKSNKALVATLITSLLPGPSHPPLSTSIVPIIGKVV